MSLQPLANPNIAGRANMSAVQFSGQPALENMLTIRSHHHVHQTPFHNHWIVCQTGLTNYKKQLGLLQKFETSPSLRVFKWNFRSTSASAILTAHPNFTCSESPPTTNNALAARSSPTHFINNQRTLLSIVRIAPNPTRSQTSATHPSKRKPSKADLALWRSMAIAVLVELALLHFPMRPTNNSPPLLFL